MNQNDKASDLNKNCGYQSDYIYLLQTRDRQDQGAIASMLGNGSVVAIVAFVVISAGVIAWVFFAQKKRRAAVSPASESEENGES